MTLTQKGAPDGTTIYLSDRYVFRKERDRNTGYWGTWSFLTRWPSELQQPYCKRL